MYNFIGDSLTKITPLVSSFQKTTVFNEWPLVFPSSPGTFTALQPSLTGSILLSIIGISASLVFIFLYYKLAKSKITNLD